MDNYNPFPPQPQQYPPYYQQPHRPQRPHRPTIITVAGIFSFIGIVIAFIRGLFSLLWETVPDHPFGDSDTWIIFPVATIVLAGMKLAGVILMFGMRKAGFFLYAIGELAASAISILRKIQFMDEKLDMGGGYRTSGLDDLLGFGLTFWIAMVIIFCIGFIAMYASQLSKMR